MGYLKLTLPTRFQFFSIVSIVLIHRGIEAHSPDAQSQTAARLRDGLRLPCLELTPAAMPAPQGLLSWHVARWQQLLGILLTIPVYHSNHTSEQGKTMIPALRRHDIPIV